MTLSYAVVIHDMPVDIYRMLPVLMNTQYEAMKYGEKYAIGKGDTFAIIQVDLKDLLYINPA